MRGETANRVMQCIAVTIGAEQIEPRMHLRGDLDMDSLDCCEMIQKLEETFSVTIKDDDADGWETVSDVIATVEKVKA